MIEFKDLKIPVLISVLLVIGLNLKAQVFTDISHLVGSPALNISTDLLGSGMSTYDINQDGWDDLSFVSESDTQKIYLNNQGSFELAPFSFFSQGENKHLLWVDYDNDYDLDIFLTRKNGTNLLLNNDGNFQFTDLTLSAGLSMEIAANYSASFADYDVDGDLDLFVCKYFVSGDSTNLAHQNNLFRNNGNGTFTDVTFVSGFDNEMAPSFQSIWLDYNHDGFPDLYIINDRITWENKFYENNGDGTFTNVTLLTQTAMTGSDPMSISLGDYDNDGDQDLFVSDAGSASQPRGTLFGQTFTFDYIDQASSLGISIPANMWGSTWLDYNNDGFLDLFVATGDIPIAKNYFYVSDSANNFLQDTSIFVGDYVSNSFAVASADFNRDGFSDIAVVNLGASTNFLWLNSQNSNNYIRISVEGTVSNSAAIGTWIKVFANNQVYTKYTVCGENYLGQNSQHHNFGVGQDTIVDSVHVEYLSGIIDKYYNLPVNERYDFTEGESIASFNVSIIGNNPFCQGDSVSLTAPNLQSYNWSNGDTTQSIVVYSQDTFELCGIDSNGLTVQSNMYFIEGIPFPSIASQLVDVSCHGEMDGEAYLRVNNEGQEYQMTWSNGLSGDSLLGLGAGIYTYSYIDIYGCSFQDSFELSNPSPLNVQVEIQAQTWGEQGSVQVLANGGVAPYIISLDNLPINNQLTPLDSGIYILTIVDGNDCSYVDTIIVLFQDSAIISSIINIAEAQLVVSPNPFTDKLMVELTNVQSSFLLWELFDSSGKLITKNEENILVLKGNYEFQISVPTSMPVGFFYLQIVCGNEVDQFKLIKQ